VRLRRAHVRHGRGCRSGHGRPASVVPDNARIHGVEGARRPPPPLLFIVGVESCGGGGIRHTDVAKYRQRRVTRDSAGTSATQAEDARKHPLTTEHRHHLSVRLSVSDTGHA